jgi:uncharacterized protein
MSALDWSAPLHPRAKTGIDLFNAGKYWHAHEALEDAWRAEPEPASGFYKGILQTAVFYHHLTNLNYEGAYKLYQRAQKWLVPVPPVCRGVHMDKLRADLNAAFEHMQTLGKDHLHQMDFTRLKPIFVEENA